MRIVIIDVIIRETENYDTTKDRSDASKNDDIPTIFVNSEIKKEIIAAGSKQPKGPFPKDLLKSGRSFSTNYYHFVTQSWNYNNIGYVIYQAWTLFTANPAVYFFMKMSPPRISYALQNP